MSRPVKHIEKLLKEGESQACRGPCLLWHGEGRRGHAGQALGRSLRGHLRAFGEGK